MTPTTSPPQVEQLTDQQVFDLLDKARAQYEAYLDVSRQESYEALYPQGEPENVFAHNLDYPLLPVLL